MDKQTEEKPKSVVDELERKTFQIIGIVVIVFFVIGIILCIYSGLWPWLFGAGVF